MWEMINIGEVEVLRGWELEKVGLSEELWSCVWG